MMSWRSNAIATAPMPNGLSSGSMTESMTSAYAELHCHSNYSFLEGASHPEELVARARDLEMPALAITDRNGFYGAVKFFGAAQRAGIQPIIGTELTIDDGTRPPKDRVDYDRWGDRLLLLVEDKLGYTSLCRVISMAQMPNAKGMARLPADQLASLSGHLIALVADPKERLPFYQEIFGRDRVFIEVHDHLAPDDRMTAPATRRCSTLPSVMTRHSSSPMRFSTPHPSVSDCTTSSRPFVIAPRSTRHSLTCIQTPNTTSSPAPSSARSSAATRSRSPTRAWRMPPKLRGAAASASIW
ncbi:MAG: PHP domain-containing protein [Chloroflexi bacterium]|nr:MAG: PHP domain-containing protein [Chloroflexota bacterium]